MQQTIEAILFGILAVFQVFALVWLCRKLYSNGWRPLIFTLAVIYWQRVMFAFAWIRFKRRGDKAQP